MDVNYTFCNYEKTPIKICYQLFYLIVSFMQFIVYNLFIKNYFTIFKPYLNFISLYLLQFLALFRIYNSKKFIII